MNDDELLLALKQIEAFEGRVAWLYLDNAQTPNVTVGVGCLVPSVSNARELNFVRCADGEKATDVEITTDFFRVISMRGSLPARCYKGTLYLADSDIEALALGRLRSNVDALPDLFDGFVSYPLPIRMCLMDLAWNLGINGLRKWANLRIFCGRRDWASAAGSCTVANPYGALGRKARNDWRVSCFSPT